MPAGGRSGSITPYSGLVQPRIIRGDLPKNRGKPPPKPSPFQPYADLCLSFPAVQVGDEYQGGWVIVSERKDKRLTCAQRKQLIKRDKVNLEYFLAKRYPLHRFQCSIVAAEGTWCDKELYMRFLEEITQEQADELKALKRQHYEWMMRRREEKQRERELAKRFS